MLKTLKGMLHYVYLCKSQRYPSKKSHKSYPSKDIIKEAKTKKKRQVVLQSSSQPKGQTNL